MAKGKPLPREFSADEQRCLEQLEDWEAAIRDLRDFIGPATFVAYDKADRHSKAWAEEARTRLKTLKQQLQTEAKRLTLIEKRDGLNDAEAHFYVRDIQQASAYLTLSPKSTSGEEWRQQLGDALTTIGYPLFQLKAKRDATQK